MELFIESGTGSIVVIVEVTEAVLLMRRMALLTTRALLR